MSIDSHPTEELDLEYAEPPNHVSSISNTVEYSRHSLSTLQETPSLDSVRRRSHVNASANGHREEDNKSVEELEIMDGSEENLHRRSVNLKTSRSPKTGDRSRNSANYIQRRSPYNDSTLSDSVDSRRKANYDRSARRHDWLIARNGYSSYNNSPIDYWTLPRTQEIFRRNFDHPDTLYQTPGGLLYPRKSHGHRSSRKSHKHRQNKEDRLVEQHLTRKQLDSSRKDVERDSLDLNSAEIPHRSELKVYFRFSKGTLSDRSGLDYLQNEPLLEALQAQCRGWLARQAFDRLLDQNEAVRTIQRNAERLFNPWIRLMLTLRPLLKSHRTEEELLFLRSELERYKTLVKMLRFENAEYQAKVANLLQLIEQINTKGSNNEVVNTLVQQISEALTKNQEFWQEMASKNKALQSTTLQRPTTFPSAEGSSSYMPPSPLTQLRQDADFYRNQVEMLKEEADEQQHRSSEHFQGQVSVLSDRVEHLQHLLAMESSKVHRLSSELEEMNNTIAEAKTHERNLEHMVSQLSKQLDQRSRARESSLTPETPPPLLSKLPPDAEKQGGDMASTNQDLEKQLNSYRQLIAQLRTYLASNPKAMSILSNSPFQPGGEMDLFNEPNSALFPSSAYISVDPMLNSSLYTQPGSPMRDDRSLGGDLTPRSSTTHEVAELKRQLNVAERNLVETGEKIKHEIEDRETLENENMQLHNRVAALDRQLRRTQDEYDEAMTRRDLVHQRKLKELTEQLEDELRKNSQMSEQNKELERELTELRNMAEPDEENVNDQWESMRSKLRSDVNQYKRALEILQDEFDQFRRENDPQTTQQQLTERDEKINLLENEKQQWRLEMEVLQVKLQNATSILEDTENRLKQATRERTTQIHRITQLESERDEAIREAANISGRASAEKENAAAKLREFEELRIERDGLRRELTDLKQTLAGCTAENAAEKRQLQARLREMEGHHEARISDFKAELERTREEMERLQIELQTLQASELEQKAANQQSRWKINELDDQLSHSLRRIGVLERRNTDLEAELVRANADLSASREAASLRKAARARMADEWYQAGGTETGEDSEDDRNHSIISSKSKQDYGTEHIGEDIMTAPRMRRTRLTESARLSSIYRSNPAIFRPLSNEVHTQSLTDRRSHSRGSANMLDGIDSMNGTPIKSGTAQRQQTPITTTKITPTPTPPTLTNTNSTSDDEKALKSEVDIPKEVTPTNKTVPESDTTEDDEA